MGAVATQSVVEPSYGPGGLELMRDGKSAPEALHELLSHDHQENVRQVAMVDRAGRVAVHSGRGCIDHAGHALGTQMSAQANIMRRDTVPAAMVRGYEAARGELAERLLAALDAAEGEGGDLRGRQSAALLVVADRGAGRPGEGTHSASSVACSGSSAPTRASTRAISSLRSATPPARCASTPRPTPPSPTTPSSPSGTAPRWPRVGASRRRSRSCAACSTSGRDTPNCSSACRRPASSRTMAS